jgi:FkbM family methyltransferase
MPVRLHLAERARHLGRAFRSLGTANALSYLGHRLLAGPTRWLGRSRPYHLVSPLADHPLACRPGTSDVQVFRQVFIERQYACLDGVKGPGLILDCGANVGYSAAYLLSRFPGARLIAVEPDPGNFALLEQNLRPYGDRARAIRSGVWSRPVGLTVVESGFRDGLEWTRQVRECLPGESPQMTAVDVGSLLEESGYERISILKIDIERAELEVFSRHYESWLPRVDHLAIELHDDECEAVFLRAARSVPFEIVRHGELTLCRLPEAG